MIWQDIVIAIANIGFVVSLLKQIYKIHALKQSSIDLISVLIYAFGLYAMGIAFLSLKLYISSILVLLSAVLWSLIYIQTYIYK